MALRACAPGARLRTQLAPPRAPASPLPFLAHAPRCRRAGSAAPPRRAHGGGARAALTLWTHPASRGKIVEWCAPARNTQRAHNRRHHDPERACAASPPSVLCRPRGTRYLEELGGAESLGVEVRTVDMAAGEHKSAAFLKARAHVHTGAVGCALRCRCLACARAHACPLTRAPPRAQVNPFGKLPALSDGDAHVVRQPHTRGDSSSIILCACARVSSVTF
jgi:hypothetical protein